MLATNCDARCRGLQWHILIAVCLLVGEVLAITATETTLKAVLSHEVLLVRELLLAYAFTTRLQRVFGTKIMQVPFADDDITRLRSVKFYWVTPNIDGSLWLMPELQQLCENDTSGLIDASVYYTRCSSEVAAVAQSDYKNINVISGRPNFRKILEELDGTHAQRTNQPLKTHMQGALLQPLSPFRFLVFCRQAVQHRPRNHSGGVLLRRYRTRNCNQERCSCGKPCVLLAPRRRIQDDLFQFPKRGLLI